MLRTLITCGLIATMSPTAAVAADDPASAMFSIGGFGTFGVIHSDQNSADYTAAPDEAVGAGHTHSWSVAVDSLFGAQVSAKLTPKLSALLQVISQQNYDDTFRPHVEWANLKYQVTPDFSMRIGRTSLGVFLVMDSLNVGFAIPWVRPPIEIYNLVSITSNDGIDASYRLEFGDASNTLKVAVGRADYTYPITNSKVVGSAESKDQVSFVDSYERGFATVRLSYGQAHVSIAAYDPLFDAFRQFGPQGMGIADKYAVDDRVVRFFGLSASYEPGQWFAMAEWGRINAHSVLGNKTGWYLSSGYRFGKFTPYGIYARTRTDTSGSDAGLNLAELPPYLAAPAQALNAGLNASLATSITTQRTMSVGVRWDLVRSVDLKLQIDRTNLGADSRGWLTNLQPGFRLGSSVDLISAVIDFVF
jgi:hypothetical protein